ncbi:MAG: hypothetical protein AB1646_24865 [Thermodesulfobacteriota bacterium]
MEYLLGVSEQAGVTRDEIGAVQACVMAVSAARVREQFREVRERFDEACGEE